MAIRSWREKASLICFHFCMLSRDTHRPLLFPSRMKMPSSGHHPHGLPWGWQKGCKSSVWLTSDYFHLFWYRMKYTHFVIHISLQMSFYGSAKSHKRARVCPSSVLPFWTQLHISEKRSATKICNVQIKVYVCSSFATQKYLLWNHLDAPCFFSLWHTVISQVLG